MFDSNDGRCYSDEKKKCDLNYYEYGKIWFDGHTEGTGVRDMQTSTERYGETAGRLPQKRYADYSIEAVRYKDHACEDQETLMALKISSASLGLFIIYRCMPSTPWEMRSAACLTA